jgi:uncharacterized membrane protein YesL
VRIKASVIVAILTGAIMLLGYFLPGAFFASVRDVMLRSGMIIGTVALLLGVGNLLQVHLRKIREQRPGHLYSIFMVISLFSVFAVVVLFGPAHPYSVWVVSEIQRPLEIGLMGLLAVVLLLAGVRLLFRRQALGTLVFFLTAFLVLLGTAPLPFISLPFLEGLRNWIVQVPTVAGARGIILGVALGATATGLRVLLGFDQPYER